MGVVLGLALAIIAVQVSPDVRPSAAPHPSPLAPKPSKENVSKQVREEIAHLKEVVDRNPSDAKSALELARTLQDGHDLQGALKYYEVGLKADPRSIEGRVDYSLCLYQAGKEQEAFAQTAKILHQDATNAHALYNLGAIYANRGQGDSATYYWKKLIASHPGDELAKKAAGNLKELGVDGGPAM